MFPEIMKSATVRATRHKGNLMRTCSDGMKEEFSIDDDNKLCSMRPCDWRVKRCNVTMHALASVERYVWTMQYVSTQPRVPPLWFQRFIATATHLPMRFIELRRIHFTIHNQPCIHVHNVTTYDARTGASSAGFSFSVICMCDPRNNTWPFESICKTHGDDAVCSFYLRVIDMLRRRRPQHRTSSYPTSLPFLILLPLTYNSNNQVLPSTEIEQAKSAAALP